MSVVEGRREEPEALLLADCRGGRRGARPTEEHAAARRDLYRFLASVFLEPPDADLVRRIVDAKVLADLGSLFGRRAVKDLWRFAATVRVKEDLGSLRQEYMDLFAVPTGRYVTPFEDVYRGKTHDGQQERGPLLGDRAIAVLRVYRAAGAHLERGCKQLPTHIGVELSFMGFLCGAEAAALSQEAENGRPDRRATEATQSSRYRELQARFLRIHLNAWFPQLSEAIQMYTTSPLYRGLALLTEEFLAWDSVHLSTESRLRREKQGEPRSERAQTD